MHPVRRSLRVLGALALCAPLCAPLLIPDARAEPALRVVATDPGAQATLGRDEPFYLRIEFTTDQPLSIWARPYFQGKPVLKAKTNPSSRHAGAGHALGWFSLDQTDEVDEARIIVGGGKPYREWHAASLPVRLTGTGQPAAARARPEWVRVLQAEADERHRREYQEQMNRPPAVGDMLIAQAFMLGALGLLAGGLLAPAWGLWKWRGAWRAAAGLPALAMAFVILRIIVDVSRDPTSHNLWPFEIVIVGLISLVAMGVLALLRRLTATDRGPG